MLTGVKTEASSSMHGRSSGHKYRNHDHLVIQDHIPVLMSDELGVRFRDHYQAKVNHTKYELVAAFQMKNGTISSYYVYRSRLPFQITERRQRILARYYSHGKQDIVMYVNELEFEHYMPIKLRPVSETSASSNNSAFSSSCRRNRSMSSKSAKSDSSPSSTATVQSVSPVKKQSQKKTADNNC